MATVDPPADAAIRQRPQRVARYELLRELGRGSTGTVYLARDAEYGGEVALKLYHPPETRPERAETRRKLFVNEARLVGALTHPNIVPVLDAGESGDYAYIVSEYVRGAEPLSNHTRLTQLLPQRRVVDILFACAKALDYAHRRGVVHRDIKPGNVLVSFDGKPMIADFGIAMHAHSGENAVTGLVGSPSYMAPEQLRDDIATAISDVYSLGVVGYELLTGQRPFRGESLSHLVHEIIYASPRPLAQLRANVPSALEAVIARAMEKDPERRYANALAMAAELARVRAGMEQDSEPLDLQDRFDIARRMPFFRDFGYAEVWEAVKHSDWCSYEEGAEVIPAGSAERRFYLVVAGELVLERNGERVTALHRNAALGELALLYGRERVTRVRASAPSLLMCIEAAQFESASPACQLAFYRRFNRNLFNRFLSVRRDLAD